MIVRGKGVFVGQETKTSQKTEKDYTIVRVLDNEGKVFEMLSDVPVKHEQFKDLEFSCNIQQGKYTKCMLMQMR